MWSYTTSKGTKIMQVGTARCNNYLVVSDSRIYLVDVGIEKHFNLVYKRVLKELPETRDIDVILCTHTHFDHVGSLAQFAASTPLAMVGVNKKGVPRLRNGFTKIARGESGFPRVISTLGNLFRNFGAYTAVIADFEIYDSLKICETVTAIETPGHTEHCSSFIIDNEVAIVGDVMLNSNMRKSVFPPFCDDREALLSSWQKLLKETECTLFLPGHGKPVSREQFEESYKQECGVTN